MRYLLLPSVISAALLTTIPSAQAVEGPWSGSFAADGACFCTGNLPSAMQQQKVPTPGGAASVLQICARIGSGPQLERIGNTYNYPVFADPQCGHGPFPAGQKLVAADCAGSLNPTEGDCQPKGPTWDLDKAFGQNTVAVTDSIQEETLSNADSSLSVATSESVTAEPISNSNPLRPRYIKVPKSTQSASKASPSTLPKNESVLTAETKNDTSAIATAPVKPLETEAERNARMEAMIEQARQRLAGTSALELPAVKSSRTQRQATVQEAPEQMMKPVQTDSAKVVENGSGVETIADTVDSTSATAKSEKPVSIIATDEKPEAIVATNQDAAPNPIKIDEPSPSLADTPDAGAIAATPTPEKPELDKPSSVEESSILISKETSPESADSTVPVLSALRLPTTVRQSGREFNYVAATPVGYDFGGAGVQLDASVSQFDKLRLLAQLGAAEEYQEVKLGAGFYYTPPRADRLTLMLSGGFEYGNFELSDQDIETSLSDSGVFLHAEGRMVLNNKFELNGGFGYSSFFEGDPILFGGGFYHINSNLDALTRFELGDNDSFGIGLRYFY